MRELSVTEFDAGQRLNKYLMKYLNQAPSSFIYKMLRKKNITRNGKKASGDEILVCGDQICLFLSDETIDKFRITKKEPSDSHNKSRISLQILYQDEDILAVHKPVGILSQKAAKNDYSINEAIVDYCQDMGIRSEKEFEMFRPSVSNRLDRNTSGIILAGISLKGSQYLARILKNHNCQKYYYTIVNGVMAHKIHDSAYILKNHEKNKSFIQKQPVEHASKIETEFEPICRNNGYTFVRVQLFTGKSHQIRAHLHYLGYPMLGDVKYGGSILNKNTPCHLEHHLLHAGKIVLPDKTEIIDPLPNEFVSVAKKLGLSIPDNL